MMLPFFLVLSLSLSDAVGQLQRGQGVRVAGELIPIDLAAYLLSDQPAWTRERIEQAASAGRERAVRVRNPLPVHVLYWTAWADTAGVLHLRDDVYDRDAALYAAMKRPPE
jgi:murein L,D-transpeptidase YcbB/YkuD